MPEEWRVGAKALTYDAFTAMLNEVNDALPRDEDGRQILPDEVRESPIKKKKKRIAKRGPWYVGAEAAAG